ncbi:MAG: SRPBCC family protein [Chloroflexi bacterium]|nr:SRPBCC family protein [Chloroflexota bacterium]
MRYERSIEIAAPPAVVWSILQDVSRWPEWTDSVRTVELIGDGPFGPGKRARLDVLGAPPAVWTVTAIDEGRSFTWESRARGVHTIAGHVIEPSGAGSRVTLTVEMSGLMASIFRPMIARVSRRNLAMEAEGLKRRSEGLVA